MLNDEQIKRFWASVDKSGLCWIWIRNRVGLKINKAEFRPRYVSYEISTGRRAPNGHSLKASCGVARCVSPEHILVIPVSSIGGTEELYEKAAREGLFRDRVSYVRHLICFRCNRPIYRRNTVIESYRCRYCEVVFKVRRKIGITKSGKRSREWFCKIVTRSGSRRLAKRIARCSPSPVIQTCSKCLKEKPIESFNVNRAMASGFASQCKECVKDITRYRAYLFKDKQRGLRTCSYEEYCSIILGKACYYCGYVGIVGADRIDNKFGHVAENIVPCCCLCNRIRGDRFTLEEMKLIGLTIIQIREKRNTP